MYILMYYYIGYVYWISYINYIGYVYSYVLLYWICILDILHKLYWICIRNKHGNVKKIWSRGFARSVVGSSAKV